MFEKDEESLKKLGAHITTAEIKQQPELWEDALEIYRNNKNEIDAFINKALEEAREHNKDQRLSVVFAGAGTSAYVGDTVSPYLRSHGDDSRFDFKAIATTDIVSAPLSYLRADDPTLFISFARSGNSPESLAAVERARQVVKKIHFLNITCAPEGHLAQESKNDPQSYTILIPRANDKGFAMTGSYTCMALMSLLIFDKASDEKKALWVSEAAAMGREVVSREDEVAKILDSNYDRITYLGSAALSGLAREAQLKVLELAAGKIATSFDSSMGYRHGPKSFVDDKTLVFVFVSNCPYTRQYDLDILNEIAGDKIALHTVGLQQKQTNNFEGEAFTFEGHELLPSAYLALPYVMVAQTLSLLNSVKVGNTPDTPSPTGTVNRVVKGVTIHPFSSNSTK